MAEGKEKELQEMAQDLRIHLYAGGKNSRFQGKDEAASNSTSSVSDGSESEARGLETAAFPPLNGVAGEIQNADNAIPVTPGTQTWKAVLKGENPPEQKIPSTPSNADETSKGPSSIVAANATVNLGVGNPSEQQIPSILSNADKTSKDPSSNDAATPTVNSGLDVENTSEQQITSTSSNADKPSVDPASSNTDAAVDSDLDAGQVSTQIETASTSAEHSSNTREFHTRNNLLWLSLRERLRGSDQAILPEGPLIYLRPSAKLPVRVWCSECKIYLNSTDYCRHCPLSPSF